MRSLNLAVQDENGAWRTTSEQFSVPSELGNTALLTYYRLSLEQSIQALNLEPESRRYSTLLVNLTAEQMHALQGEFMGFLDQMLAKYGSQKGEGTRLYQLNQSLIAVTPVLGQSPDAGAVTEESVSEVKL